MNIQRYGDWGHVRTKDSAEDIEGLFEDGQLRIPGDAA